MLGSYILNGKDLENSCPLLSICLSVPRSARQGKCPSVRTFMFVIQLIPSYTITYRHPAPTAQATLPSSVLPQRRRSCPLHDGLITQAEVFEEWHIHSWQAFNAHDIILCQDQPGETGKSNIGNVPDHGWLVILSCIFHDVRISSYPTLHWCWCFIFSLISAFQAPLTLSKTILLSFQEPTSKGRIDSYLIINFYYDHFLGVIIFICYIYRLLI